MTLAAWLAALPGAAFLRESGTAYLLVNAAHILGIGLLVGAILPLDLRLAGLFRGPQIPVLAPFLSRAAACGLALAALTGLFLLAVKPDEYFSNAAFLWKMGILALALANVALQHAQSGYAAALAGGPVSGRVRIHAAASSLLWLAVLLSGRWIGFLA